MMVNRSMVNKSAPELFPAVYLVKKRYIRRETRERRAFRWTPAISSNTLKIINLLSLTNYPLN